MTVHPPYTFTCRGCRRESVSPDGRCSRCRPSKLRLARTLPICESNRCGNFGTDRRCRRGCQLLKTPCRLADRLLRGDGCPAPAPQWGEPEPIPLPTPLPNVDKAPAQPRSGATTAPDWDRPKCHVDQKIDGPAVTIPSNATTRVAVDWVVPYGPGDLAYMSDLLRSVGWQQAADIHLHLVPDNGAPPVEYTPPAHVTLHRYARTDGRRDRLGPYRIVNAVAAEHLRTDWLFVVDADDISLPQRAWESVATAERNGCEQVAGAMIQFVDGDDETLGTRQRLVPYWLSGMRYPTSPLGMIANPTRCISAAAFRRMNGFESWPTSADFEFDHRSQFGGVRTFKTDAVWAIRRMHSASITNAKEHARRKAYRDEIVRRQSLADLSGCGGMSDDAGLLRPICGHNDSQQIGETATLPSHVLETTEGNPPPPQTPSGKVRLVTTNTTPTIRESYTCDVVIPYNATAVPFLRDAICSILNQNFVEPIVHLINDGVVYDSIGQEFSRMPNVRLYHNVGGPTGPYVIYNRIFDHLETDVWANQDADDLALPNRLFKSLRLIHDGCDIVGGAMEQFVDHRFASDSMRSATRKKPYHRSGTQLACSPSGNVINSTMTIRKSVYEEANGMADWYAGADSEFIERCILAGKKAVAMTDVVALRRLNQQSLSNGGLNGHGSDYRAKIRKLTLDSIAKQRERTDHTIGTLNKYRSDGKLVRVN